MACNDANIRTIILFICVPLCPSKQYPPCSHTLEFDEIQMLVIYGLGYLSVYAMQEQKKCFRTEEKALSRKEIIESVKDSLKNLQLEYIDLLIVHKNDPNCPLEGNYPS